MAIVSFISTSKLASLLAAADPQKTLLVRVLNATRLSLETDSFQQVSIIDLAEEKVIPGNSPIAISVTAPKTSRKSGKYQLIVFGETVDTHSLKDLLSAGLLALEKAKPGTLEKLSKVKKSTKRIVARNPSDLFDTPGLSGTYSQQLMAGWWYGTNNSALETKVWLERACECAGVKWGMDFSTSL